MDSKLFIPKKIKVGFNNRSDTYTGKLGYVIYWDAKGVLRKVNSWEGWRSKEIEPQEFNNEPMEGFVLNRDVGGGRRSYYSWDARIEKVRVYDPRGFEFEISIPNLLFILQECTSTKGKGIEGEMVYSWNGPELVLLPVSCKEYKECLNYTEYQKCKFSAKNLKVGLTYRTKKMEDYVYMGQYVWTPCYGSSYGKKCHIFGQYEINQYSKKPYTNFRATTSTDFLAEQVGDAVDPTFADLFTALEKEDGYATCTSIVVKKPENRYSSRDNYNKCGIFYKNEYYIGSLSHDYKYPNKDYSKQGSYKYEVELNKKVSIVDGGLVEKIIKEPIKIECTDLTAEGITCGALIATNSKNKENHIVYVY